MSTLDAADIDVMRATKTCVAATRFQYDYLNDNIKSPLAPLLQRGGLESSSLLQREELEGSSFLQKGELERSSLLQREELEGLPFCNGGAGAP